MLKLNFNKSNVVHDLYERDRIIYLNRILRARLDVIGKIVREIQL